MRILLIDNNDSFTLNLHHQTTRLTGEDTDITAYETLPGADISAYGAFVISAGPGHPDEYTAYGRVLESGRPVFGVCLGMQIINTHFGGKVSRLSGCRHGVALPVSYRGETCTAAVYNSLYCSEVPECLDIFARYKDVPMGLSHKKLPVSGVQFHPESFLSKDGDMVIKDVFNNLGII